MIEKKKPSDDFIRIQDLWGMFVPKWHWFAISLFITLAVAMLYLLSTPPIYTRTAAILVKDNSNSSSSTGAMNEFSDLGIFKSNTNINNELDVEVPHIDDRGSQPVGIERELHRPQGIEGRRFIQIGSRSRHVPRQDRNQLELHHRVILKRHVHPFRI